MIKKLEGKIAVVTGGTSGIGLATAELFVKEGAYVFITGRRQKELDAAVKQIGKNVTGVQGDVSKLADIDRLYSAVKQQKRPIDILFANAGVYEPGMLGSLTEEHYDKLFNINVKGLLFTIQGALPLFQDGGTIILNASVVASKGMEALSIYSATKAAVRSFARTWSVDLKKRHIRVNALSPGVIPTAGFSSLGMNDEEMREFTTKIANIAPSGRTGTPQEIASAALFLASNDSSYVNGIELFVDGGLGQI